MKAVLFFVFSVVAAHAEPELPAPPAEAVYPQPPEGDDACKFIRSAHDGRIRVLCMADGEIHDTWGQCKTYCR